MSSPFDVAESLYQKQQSINSQNRSIFDVAEQNYQKENIAFEEGDLERDVERSQAQLTSRGLETVLGAPGDLLSLVSGITGIEGLNALPTSASLRKKSEKLTKGYTAPKSEFEEKGGELFSDITAMAFPGAGQYGFLRNIGIPLVANIAKEGIKGIGGDDKNAQYGKIGTMVFLDLLGHRKGVGMGGAKNYASHLYNESEKLISPGTMVEATGFETSLNKLQKSLESGGSAPSTASALKKIDELKGKIKDGKIEAKELMDARKRINEIIATEGGFEVRFPKHVKAKTIRNLQDVKGQVIDALNNYGDKFNPEFSKLNRNANEAWAAYEQSNKISKFIKDSLKVPLKSNGAKILLGLGSGTAGIMLPAVGKAVGAATAAGAPFYLSYKYIDRMRKSPVLRKYYQNIITSSLAGNVEQMNKNITQLDNLLLKEDEKPKE